MKIFKKCSGGSKAFASPELVLPDAFILFAALIAGVSFFSCGPAREEMEKREAYAKASDEISDTVFASVPGIATDTINGVTHNFIRKADIKFKVKDVLNSSKKIEDVVGAAGGYISSSELTSHSQYSNSTRISKDSILEQTYYTTINTISLRVPNQKLDTVLRQISNLALFIDHRNLSSDDVKMKLFSNKLAEERHKNFKKNLIRKTEVLPGKQAQVVTTEDALLNNQAKLDDKKIETYDLADQVNYSTVSIEIYQSPSYIKQYLAVEEQIEPYQPSFFEKAGDGFVNGFGVLKSFILFVINSWGVILILILIYFVIRAGIAYNKQKKNLA